MFKSKILVVEDDALLQKMMADVLESAGYAVVMADNGHEGLLALAEHQPQLVVSDVSMPVMDGFAFYTAMRHQPAWMDVPVIFITARADKWSIRQGQRLGVDDYLVKPFDHEDLLSVVQGKLQRQAQMVEVRAQAVQQLKRSILTTLNHEFRTPLTHITTYTEMLRETDPAQHRADFEVFLRGIQAGSQRLLNLVEDFMLLVEFQTGEAQEAFARRREPLTDLVSILYALVVQNLPGAQARGLTLTLDAPDTLPCVLGDRELLSNALRRLLDNAIKFSRHTGQVVMHAQATANSEVRITIADQGIGIRSDALETIFNLFEQVDRHYWEQQGIGAGLTIAHEVARLHHGYITVRSQVGVGSEFTLHLPLCDPGHAG